MTEQYVITGASRGIGQAAAEKLATDGVHLILHGRDEKAMETTCLQAQKNGATVQPVFADLSDPGQVDRVVEAVGEGNLRALINNAGVAWVNPVSDLPLEEWNTTFAVNVTAPFLLSKRLLPRLSSGSSILFISSTGAKAGYPNWGSYCASKFALDGFAKSLREEVRADGIRVINIYPGSTDTDIWDGIPGQWPRDRMMTPGDVAEAIVFALKQPSNVLIEDVVINNVSGKI